MTKNNMEDGISKNFINNLYSIASFTGYGITNLERSAGVGSGYCSMCKLRNSSPTLRVVEMFSKSTGYKVEDLVRDPEEFRKKVLNLCQL